MALNGEGQRLLERVSDAIATIDGAVAAADGDAVRATLRINGPAPAIDHRLTPHVLTFLASHPEIRVEIVTEGALVDIVAAGFDAGIRYGESLAADMIAVPLGADQRQVVVGSPAYVARHGRPASPEDLVAHRCLGILLGPGHLLAWSFGKGGRAIEFAPSGPLVSSTSDVQREAARAGLGLAFLFEEFVAADLAAGALETVLDDWCPPFRGPFLYYPERRLMPAGLRAFVDHVRAETAPSRRDARR